MNHTWPSLQLFHAMAFLRGCSMAWDVRPFLNLLIVNFEDKVRRQSAPHYLQSWPLNMACHWQIRRFGFAHAVREKRTDPARRRASTFSTISAASPSEVVDVR